MSGADPAMPLLRVQDLSVSFTTASGTVLAVDRLSFDLASGRSLCVVGESGSGKSAMALALLGLHSPNARLSGEAWLDGQQLIGAGIQELNAIRGARVAMVFQDALSALHPYFPVGKQIVAGWRRRTGASKQAAAARAVELLIRVGIPGAAARAKHYPHQFSGGMRQRAMIAMALSCEPDLIVADEPTTALDVTVQAQMLELLKDVQQELGTALLFVTHDLGVVAELGDEIMVMYGGRKVEMGTREAIFASPRHPYTLGLMSSVPRIDRPVARLAAIPGSPPALPARIDGCPFAPRCPRAREVGDRCVREMPPLRAGLAGQSAYCHLPEAGPIVEERAHAAR